MLVYYFRIALRGLLTNKTFTAINIAGLSIGLACFIIIMLSVLHDLSYDRFHSDAGLMYRVVKDFVNEDGSRIPDATTPPALAPALQKDLPEVAQSTRVFPNWGEKFIFKYDEKRFYESEVMRVDSNFLQVFDFPLLTGEKDKVLEAPNSILLTESAAKKYFKQDDPIGKTISIKPSYADFENYTVTGILRDLPATTHFKFDYVIRINFGNINSNWGWYNFYTYVKLKPNGNPDAFAAKLQPLVRNYEPKEKNVFYAQAVTDIHLKSKLKWELGTNSDMLYVRIFIIIACAIIIIASVNHINLITAQAAKRAKEIGIRKVSGAAKGTLLRQFLVECLVTVFVAAVVALLIVWACQPFTRQVFGTDLSLLSPESQPIWGILVGAILLTCVLAGLYPALYLSSFQPIRVLKGRFINSVNSIKLRQGLVVFQFVMSTMLIIAVIVITHQLKFIQNKKLGFNQDFVLVVPNAGGLSSLEFLTGEIQKVSSVVNAGGADGVLGGMNWTTSVKIKGKKEATLLNYLSVDHNFLPTMDVTFLQGRNFSKQFGTDTSAVVLNEAAVKQMNLQEPLLGQEIIWREEPGLVEYARIIGVVKDFHFASFHESIKPFGFKLGLARANTLFVKVRPENLNQTIRSVKAIWTKLVPDRPFEYTFQDEQIAALHQSETRFQRLFSSMTTLAVIIACMGLFGLATFISESKTKEIGIRKVLGASISSIIGLLYKEFVVLVGVSCLIAFPLAGYAMTVWLRGFVYRVDLSWWTFAIAGFSVLLIALLTVSYQALKSAIANPIKSIRSEGA